MLSPRYFTLIASYKLCLLKTRCVSTLKMFRKFVCLFLVLSPGQYANSINVLVFDPIAAPSHHFISHGLVKGLLRAGHQVTSLSAFHEEKTVKSYASNYTEVVLTGVREDMEKTFKRMDFFKTSTNPFLSILRFVEMTGRMSETILKNTVLQEFLASAEKTNFDVVVVESFGMSAFYVLGEHFRAPLVLLSTQGPNMWVNDWVGNPSPPSYIPVAQLGYSPKMNFWQRTCNSLFHGIVELMFNTYGHRSNRAVLKEYIPIHEAKFDEIVTNASVVLLNSHESINDAVPLVPNMVQVGGLHVEPPKQLPKDLKDFLDGAKDGAVYFSLGSNLKSANLPIDKRTAIINVLGKLKQRVLWKFEDESLNSELPRNVMVRKWLPQQDILAHENVKLFISHGGLLSTTETVYNGVPVLAIPVFGDQFSNALSMQRKGFALSLPFMEFTEKKFERALEELLNNPKYIENARTRSRIFHDRQQSPLDTAVYWVEYVARHRGAPHLRVAGVDLPFYKYFLLDVIAFSLLLAAIPVFITCKIVKKLKARFCGCCKKNNKQQKLKKQ